MRHLLGMPKIMEGRLSGAACSAQKSVENEA